VSLREQIGLDRSILESIGDVSLFPDISIKRIKRASKSYGLKEPLDPQKVLLMVDNTIFNSGKQGLILTENHLHSFTNISGALSIPMDEINSVSPQVRKAIGKAFIPGIVINGGYFAALPGMTESIRLGNYDQAAIVILCLILKGKTGCRIDLEPEEDPGPPPWYDFG